MKNKKKGQKKPPREIKWYGIVEEGELTGQFKGLEENYEEIFDTLREGRLPETTQAAGTIPDLRERLISYGKRRIKDEFSEDQLIIKLFGLRLEMDRIINLYLEKTTVLEHLSGFPEYGNDPCRFFALIGSDTEDPGLNTILREISTEGVRMCGLRTNLSTFIAGRIGTVMPNSTALVGADLATEILYLGGGLKNLVRYPASTLQVLGADKAFFKHMRSGTPPPKHGVIFKFPGISSLPPKRRGRVSRTLANKLAIAVRADYFGGTVDVESMRDTIKERMMEKRP